MPGKLGNSQKEAWAALLLSHAAATRKIDAVLKAEGLPSLELYDVLLALEDAPDQRLRMTDLAQRVVFSPSGLTRLIDRMERCGLVQRMACPKDRRAIYVTVTPQGLTAREGAWPRYSELIQEHFGRFMSESEAGQVACGLWKVQGAKEMIERCAKR